MKPNKICRQNTNQQNSDPYSASNINKEHSLTDLSGPLEENTKKESSIYHVPSFLLKLFEIVDGRGTSSIVDWTEPEGDGFIIKNPVLFGDQILPQYFKHNNFSSFIRQLNMYDFHKSKRKGTTDQVFKHPFFLKDKRHLLPQIKRKSNSNHPHKIQKQLRNQIKQNSFVPKKTSRQQSANRLGDKLIRQESISYVSAQPPAKKQNSRLIKDSPMVEGNGIIPNQNRQAKNTWYTSPKLASQQRQGGYSMLQNNEEAPNIPGDIEPNQSIVNLAQQNNEAQIEELRQQDMFKNREQFENQPLEYVTKKGSFFELKDPIVQSIIEDDNTPQPKPEPQIQNKKYAKYSAPKQMEMNVQDTLFTYKPKNFIDDYQLGSQNASNTNNHIQSMKKMDEQIKALQELAKQSGDLGSNGISKPPPNSRAGVDSVGFSFQRENPGNNQKTPEKLLQKRRRSQMQGLEDELSDYQSSDSKNSMESPRFNKSKKRRMAENEDKTPQANTSTKERVKYMSDQASQLSKSLRTMMDRFSKFESKLRDLSSEHQKQRTINDHLLSQLVKSKEKEQMFEKIMTLVLQFFQDKNKPAASEKPNPSEQEITDMLQKIADKQKLGMALNDKDREIFQFCLNSIVTTEKNPETFHPTPPPMAIIQPPKPIPHFPQITNKDSMYSDILPIPPSQIISNTGQKSEHSTTGFKLKLKVDDTDYYSKKLDQHFDQYQKMVIPTGNQFFNQPQVQKTGNPEQQMPQYKLNKSSTNLLQFTTQCQSKKEVSATNDQMLDTALRNGVTNSQDNVQIMKKSVEQPLRNMPPVLQYPTNNSSNNNNNNNIVESIIPKNLSMNNNQNFMENQYYLLNQLLNQNPQYQQPNQQSQMDQQYNGAQQQLYFNNQQQQQQQQQQSTYQPQVEQFMMPTPLPAATMNTEQFKIHQQLELLTRLQQQQKNQ